MSNELMTQFTMTMRNKPQKPLLATARKPTYKTCRKCNSMLIEDSRGGLKCINTHEDNNLDFSRHSDLTDVQR